MQYISVLQRKKNELDKIESQTAKDYLNIFDEEIFKQIKDIFPQKKQYKANEFKLIIKGLQNDTIKYSRSQQGFKVENTTEKLAIELREIGANYNSQNKLYSIGYYQLPPVIQSVVASKVNEMEELTKKIEAVIVAGAVAIAIKNLANITKPNFEKIATITANGIVEGLDKVLETPPVPEGLEKIIDTSPTNNITADDVFTQRYNSYFQSTDKSIKGFTQKEIADLRSQVAEIRLRGGTVQDVKDLINNGRNLTEARMNLIAKQETKLANSAYEQDVCGKAGLRYFKWIHPNISKEPRQHHLEYARMSKEENFLFDSQNPPIDPKTNKPEMPGEPIGCNCYAVFVKEI